VAAALIGGMSWTGWFALMYYPVHSASALVIYERGHVSAGEILRFGFWMTLVAYVAIACVALPYWAAMGQPLVPGGLGTSG
jgi:di/tricarboxylate transporter